MPTLAHRRYKLVSKGQECCRRGLNGALRKPSDLFAQSGCIVSGFTHRCRTFANVGDWCYKKQLAKREDAARSSEAAFRTNQREVWLMSKTFKVLRSTGSAQARR